MALFLILCIDRPDARELRAATRPTHLAYLEGGEVKVKIGGALLDEGDGGPLGSMMVVEAAHMAAARAFAAEDPYAKAGLFASVEVRPWRLAVGGFA